MSLWTWGANSHGQLGLGEINEQVEIPTKVEIQLYGNSIKQVSCGGGHSLLLDSEGRLFSCGWNYMLQLGIESEEHQFQRVWNLSGITFTNIAAGWDFSCGVTDDHFLFVWGANTYGQLGLPKEHFPENVKPTRLQVNACAVAMGLRHTAIVNSKGEVWVTGWGKYGQLGLGEDKLLADRFTKVPKLGIISHISCGQKHTVAWSSVEKALYVWGDNKCGQLLIGHLDKKYEKIFTPQKIDIDVKKDVKKLLSGWSTVVLWLEDGSLMGWGANNKGQLATDNPFLGKIMTIKLPDNREVKDVAVGSEHTVCLATDNTLWAWGWNEHANTGIKQEREDANISVPTQVPLNVNGTLTQIYAGGAHNFLVIEPSVEHTKQENA